MKKKRGPERRLYLLKRAEEPNAWDIYSGFLVCADDETSARKIARKAAGTSDYAKDFLADVVVCTLVGFAAPDVLPGVILESFKAG